MEFYIVIQIELIRDIEKSQSVYQMNKVEDKYQWRIEINLSTGYKWWNKRTIEICLR